MSKKHMGSSIDAFMKQEGIFEQAQKQAIKEVVAWQLAQAMREPAGRPDAACNRRGQKLRRGTRSGPLPS